jgi:hypothetical protein
MSALGLSAALYVLVKYTFVGELIEKAYSAAFGGSPVDQLAADVNTAKREAADAVHQTAAELDRL